MQKSVIHILFLVVSRKTNKLKIKKNNHLFICPLFFLTLYYHYIDTNNYFLIIF
jgi:hypothetical protein